MIVAIALIASALATLRQRLDAHISETRDEIVQHRLRTLLAELKRWAPRPQPSLGDFANLTVESAAFVALEVSDQDVLDYLDYCESDDEDGSSSESEESYDCDRAEAQAAIAALCDSAISEAQQAIGNWRKETIAHLASLVRGTFESGEPAGDAELLQRPSSLFRCRKCTAAKAHAWPGLTTHKCLNPTDNVNDLTAKKLTVKTLFVALDKEQRLAIPKLLKATGAFNYRTATDLVAAGRAFFVDPTVEQPVVKKASKKLAWLTARLWDIGRFVSADSISTS